ncbi:hypothetical protein F506_20215 [Herbaspirillum hiltneri N3]|uniref:Uncharacterized protein n=1 Tax=Herbaspirillum hiltneri N3 TaxID=1262470 RepID=A0ABM5V4V6_9BURK|nr:hypothetical protein F506_20215 [Herbaspirillum hiltneri N3]
MQVLIEKFSISSKVHPGEEVHVTIQRDTAYESIRRLKGTFQVDLYVGAHRLEQNYYGLTESQAKETVLRYLLEQVDGIAPPLH